ncbi:12097_t:CDS:10 [Cetraspora pellucida]|uniref:12097_t:CDS:1 n=1 Tax=Cetraspora pellucida TaxID=1433469 RepID=A0ACA9MLD0_9GLOM|nr:12097_t:CDS:10 [Cetraspora pellucida]
MLLVQKNTEPDSSKINEAIRLFSGLADLDFEPGYNNYIYFQYLSNSKDDITLLDTHHSEKFLINILFELQEFASLPHFGHQYKKYPNSMNPELPSLDKNKISHKDLLFRILIAYADIIYTDLKHLITLNAFVLASSSNANKCRFYKSWFSLQLLGSSKENRVKIPAIFLVKEGYCKLEDYLSERDFFQLIKDKIILSKGASLVMTKYRWLKIASIRKRFVNFQSQLLEQKNYKLDHKELAFEEASEIEEASETYPDFLSFVYSTTFIHSSVDTGKTKALKGTLNSLARNKENLSCFIWVSYCKTLSNKTKSKIESTHHIELYGRQSYVVILDEVNAIMHQMFSETVKILYDPEKSLEAIRRSLNMLQEEAGIFFEIPNHFDAIIGISNIKIESSEVFQEPNRNLIHAKLSALRLIDLSTAVKEHQEWDKIADCYVLDASSAVETYIEAEYQRCLSAKYFLKILCSLVSSTKALLEIIFAKGTITDREIVSNSIKAVKKNIKSFDAELIANTPNIILDNAEVLKQIFIHSFTDNMILQ